MPLMETTGNISADAYAGGVAVVPTYIEDVFVSWLSTGNGTSRTVTGPDMTKGGLSITKSRSAATGWHYVDTVRGAGNSLSSNTTSANTVESTGVTAFTTTGTSIGAAAEYNTNGATYVDYLLRKQPKFFDVVTWTGTTGNPTTIAHSLGSVPGCIIFKKTSDASGWYVYHQGVNGGTNPQDWYLRLDTTTSQVNVTVMNNTAPTSTQFSISGFLNNAGDTWVAYIFAHNAGGFGLTGTDNVISCGSYTEGASDTTVNLGFEPQWILMKPSNLNDTWLIVDTMRGMSYTNTVGLKPQSSAAETNYGASYIQPTATGFIAKPAFYGTGANVIYIAIRRGPMKVPTDGTKVFGTDTFGSTSPTPPDLHASFPVDFAFYRDKSSVYDWYAADRLRGAQGLSFNNTNAESAITAATFDYQNGWYNSSVVLSTYQSWMFRRAPGFFDEVCYTGNSSGSGSQTLTHNLTVSPELIIIKDRTSGTRNWIGPATNFTSSNFKWGLLNLTDAFTTDPYSSSIMAAQPTATTFTVSYSPSVNNSGDNYVAYLFASAPGVSKVGSYTGNGSTQTIDCGFTGGARFVLIKRTDSTGDWYVYDTARGMTTLTDPYLLLNSTAAESATLGSVTTVSTGFAVNAAILAAINTNGASYIFWAVA